MAEKETIFEQLRKIDVSKHVEKKGNFDYLSWTWAVQEFRLACPSGTWEVKHFDGKPFMATDCGYFVEVSVTVDGITLAQIHPVLDHKNQTLKQPNAFQINTSIQRCLVKAIALHGLGLGLYVGEDLPVEQQTENKEEPESEALPTEEEKKKFLAVMTNELERVGQEAFYNILSAEKHNGLEELSEKVKSERSRVYLLVAALPTIKKEGN